MKICFIPLLLTVSLPAFAEVDGKIHKLCIEAKDYAGCVRAMKGDTSPETTVNQIQRKGANLTEGNTCPAQHLSSGGGYCQRVICIKAGLWGKGHDQGLGGKGNFCKGGAELRWDNNHQPVRAAFDKRCPPGDLDIGFANTCRQAEARGYATYYSSGYKIDQNYIVDKIWGEPAKGKLEIGDKVLRINGLKPLESAIDLHNSEILTTIVEREGEVIEFTWTTTLQKVEIPKAKKL